MVNWLHRLSFLSYSLPPALPPPIWRLQLVSALMPTLNSTQSKKKLNLTNFFWLRNTWSWSDFRRSPPTTRSFTERRSPRCSSPATRRTRSTPANNEACDLWPFNADLWPFVFDLLRGGGNLAIHWQRRKANLSGSGDAWFDGDARCQNCNPF